MVYAAQSTLFGKGAASWSKLAPSKLPTITTDPDVTIALSGIGAADYTLFLDNRAGIGHAPLALMAGHFPFIEFRTADGSPHVSGLPSIEEPEILPRALDQFTNRLITLFAMVMDRRKRDCRSFWSARKHPSAATPLTYLAASLAQKLHHRATRGRHRADHWRIGIRPRREMAFNGDIGLDGFSLLPDDGARYYADPVLWHEAGRDYLFLEEYPYATGKGIISYTELTSDGEAAFPPRPVITREGHLSYPFLFRHEGEIWMIPENAAEGHIPLYRARRFPDEWVFERPLIEGLALHDATLFAHDGFWWLLGNAALHKSSSWDCLMIYRAESPLGPFTPHRSNPVLVDARDTRPAGVPLLIEGKLVRPVQNCLGGYGRFTRFMEIDELSLESFRQHQIARLAAPEKDTIAGVHTYSRSARFEAVDILTPRGFAR